MRVRATMTSMETEDELHRASRRPKRKSRVTDEFWKNIGNTRRERYASVDTARYWTYGRNADGNDIIMTKHRIWRIISCTARNES